MHLVRDLRNRCPWDAAQTPETLRPYLVEEVLELDQAIASGDRDRIKDELGDLLLHVAFQIVLAEEDERFGSEDLTQQVERKMWRRHPHLFGGAADGAGGAGTTDDTGRDSETAGPTNDPGNRVADNGQRWEAAKRSENPSRPSVLDGLPPTLPALIMAYRLQERAAGMGFDWPNAEGPQAKVHEEIAELERALGANAEPDAVTLEIGDVLFAMVNLSRKLGHDARAALEQANAKFERRFRAVEQLAANRGVELGRASLEELDRLWDEVKQNAG